MRIAFIGTAHSIYPHYIELSCASGIINPPARTFSDLMHNFSLTKNKGNLIHGEAPSRIFKYDRYKSANIRLVQLDEQLKTKNISLREYMSERFDICIVSLANFIKPNDNRQKLANALENIDIPIYIFGAGIQHNMPPDITLLDAGTRKLLELCDTKAVFFGTRGELTSNWLHRVGFSNAKAVGCPSMYVYPDKMFGLKPLPFKPNLKYMTSGHFAMNRLQREDLRYRPMCLAKLLEGHDVSYVFQDEFFYYTTLMNENIFDDASCTIDHNEINLLFEHETGYRPTFERYYYFQDTSSWRAVASSHDCYIGDRLHGGIVAMQSGLPSIIIYDDARVKELVDFFSIPSFHMKHLQGKTLYDLIAEKLNDQSIIEFKNKYNERYKNFIKEMEFVGLEIAFNHDSTKANIDAIDTSDNIASIIRTPKNITAHQIQVRSNTKYDRYPKIFSAASNILNRQGKILSFGCSTGEEIWALSDKYFANSQLYGVDVDWDNISHARQNMAKAEVNGNKIIIELSSDEWLAGHSFDCIFALSVLCVWPLSRNKANINSIFPFELFNSTVAKLDKALKKDGIIVIHNSNYSFEDTDITEKYIPIHDDSLDIGFVHRFDKNGNREINKHGGVIFRKL